MQRTRLPVLSRLRIALLSAFTAACSNADQSPIAIDCTDTMKEVYKSVDDVKPFDASRRGEIVRCTPAPGLSAQQIRQALDAAGYASDHITSGASAYVIAYRTTRMDSDHQGITSALVYLPTRPIVRGAQPLVVFGHDTVGLGDGCAPSRNDPLLDIARIGLVGRGFTVFAPDYAGYGYRGEPPGYLSVPDQGHALLDATRAAHEMLPNTKLSRKAVLVGQSQGGHAVLGAQTLLRDYGVEGELNGVVAFAPIWFPLRSFGALPVIGGPDANAEPYAFAMYYLYSHGALLDGAGQGGVPFREDLREDIVAHIAKQCLPDMIDYVQTLGPEGADVYTQDFLDGLTTCAATKQRCDNAVADKWMPRFADDRPAIDAAGAPMVIWQGGMDTTVTPARARCGVDKITSELAPSGGATLTTCVAPEGTHDSIVSLGMDWVASWILARTTGGTEPAPCEGADSLPACPELPSPTNED